MPQLVGIAAAAAAVPAARVLSIQSHVVRGYVGNKAAVLPMQVLGVDVDPINSVQFCAHKGYKVCTGEVLQGEALWQLVDGLKANGLLDYTHVLTGYIGSESFLRTVIRTLTAVREASPGAVYVCDPVLGDHGKLYVPESLVAVYRDDVVPLASVLTPNQFEAELLTGVQIAGPRGAYAACDVLHSRGVRTVVITSTDQVRTEGDERGTIVLYASQAPAPGAPNADPERLRLDIPAVPGAYTGTGDLTAALILAWTHRLGDHDLAGALERAIATVQSVLQRTHDTVGPGKELQLVQSVGDMLDPDVRLRCRRVDAAALEVGP